MNNWHNEDARHENGNEIENMRKSHVKGWINVELIIFFSLSSFSTSFLFLSVSSVRSFFVLFFFFAFHFPTLFELVEKRFHFYYCRSIICRQCINIIPIVSISSIYLRRVVCPYAIFFFLLLLLHHLLCRRCSFPLPFRFSFSFCCGTSIPPFIFWLDVDLIHCHSKRYSTRVATHLPYPPTTRLYKCSR